MKTTDIPNSLTLIVFDPTRNGEKMIRPGSYHFRPDPLTPWGGFTPIEEKMIRPGSYRFRLIALTHWGGFTRNGEKMISPGSYRFRPGPSDTIRRLHR